jgi:glutathione-regulated potassium-efflux system ancillary protein KefG
MARVLILFAHPVFERSRVQRRMVDAVPSHDDLTFHDLYETYPRLDIDVEREQALLLEHDIVVFQHPFYWYSVPPIIKQWIDLVLEHGWAYGSAGNALKGKQLGQSISAGGGESAYQPGGYNGHTVRQFLAPIEQTAKLCKMEYLDPFVVFGTHRMTPPEMDVEAARYGDWLRGLLANGAEGGEA